MQSRFLLSIKCPLPQYQESDLVFTSVDLFQSKIMKFIVAVLLLVVIVAVQAQIYDVLPGIRAFAGYDPLGRIALGDALTPKVVKVDGYNWLNDRIVSKLEVA
ncbi:unnamed protein product [Hermetia illucens]|uniref:Uncharacterized protein n=1 Tax=Hermetia illucens TaxID=343691 RepID=A0A7R8UEI4_HERIL|nr:uncharacterized protein LOC119661223 [Hermetia illucens]CAD7079318.1 unnamed protein product [Hermetia illucens]